ELIPMALAKSGNGRTYCPTTMQFVSPDPLIQSPHSTANYNRYSYCMNNPIMYSDPSGYRYYHVEEPWFNPYAGNLMGHTSIGGSETPHINRARQESYAKYSNVGWSYIAHSGMYDNKYSGASMEASEFNASGIAQSMGVSMSMSEYTSRLDPIEKGIGGSNGHNGRAFGQLPGFDGHFFDYDTSSKKFYIPYTNTEVNPLNIMISSLADGNGGEFLKYAMVAANTSLGIASEYIFFKGKYYKWNEVWHKTKESGYAKVWQRSRWKNPGAKHWRINQLNTVSKARSISTKLGVLSSVLLVADIGLSGEVMPSHIINATAIGGSFTGIGSIAAAGWFIADFGTMGVNYIINGEARGIGDMLDEKYGPVITLYEGVY
ncbi:RHS repeat-associated core domain-containing protein, partial [Saccharicrinis sp. GN24d3]|uniref:RHS repeat-associated core domain-containing protein n=1 Tax=Saccharicrinis sp. GN24d3 TaxID=3458416 RepID=UPI004036CE07